MLFRSQHFLLDGNLTARIVRGAGSLAGRHVVEVGPGPGGLTRALLETDAASITVVEVDKRAIQAMAELAATDTRLRVLEADALSLDLTTLVPAPRRIVANLPYNIATPLLVGWLRQAAAWEGMTLMFQQEVADRIAAAPDSAAYGRLSVLAQWVCDVAMLLRLPPGASDEAAVENVMKSFRLRQDEMYDLSLISPTKAEKLLKSNPKRWSKVQEHITQSAGKPSVAPVADPRPALDVQSVADDFRDLLTTEN